MFGKITKFGGNWLKNKTVQAKSKTLMENNPPLPAYRVNVFTEGQLLIGAQSGVGVISTQDHDYVAL